MRPEGPSGVHLWGNECIGLQLENGNGGDKMCCWKQLIKARVSTKRSEGIKRAKRVNEHLFGRI